MITSTTELLSDLVELISQNPLGKVCETISGQLSSTVLTQQSRKDFAVRYGCLQSTFLRSSWLEKMKWLTQLLEGLRTIDSLSLILNTLRVTCSKSTVYAGSQYTTNFVYDKALQDHDRSLHKGVLTETQESELQWFKTLEDSEQILILIGLIRLGGGSIMHQIYERGAKLYHKRVQEAENAQRDSILQIKPETRVSHTSSSNIQVPRKLRNSLVEQFPTLAPRIFKVKPDNETEFETYDPKDPFVIEVEKQRKIWNDMISKYRIQVEGKPTKVSKGETKGGSKKGKSEKSSVSGKSAKSGKSSKADKKGKKGKDEDEAMDQIQLLPIWIVKKIFCYLDAKTLKKVKTVNKYWTYAITDLQKEQKARKSLDKFIRKMEASVISTEMQLEENPKLLKEIYDTSSPKKRLLKLSERGATLPKLKGKFEKPLTDKCITNIAVNLVPERYILPINNLKTFPRSVTQAANLYKVPSCMVNELGFTKINFEKAPNDEEVKPIYTSKSPDEGSHHSGQITDLVSEEELRVLS